MQGLLLKIGVHSKLLDYCEDEIVRLVVFPLTSVRGLQYGFGRGVLWFARKG